jgi:hypothetical protein
MDDDDDPGGEISVWGHTSLAINNTSQAQSILCKTCKSLFVPIDSRYKHCPSCKNNKPSKAKQGATKRDSSAALLSLQDTNITKLQKDDNFPFQFDAAFEMDVVSFLALDSTVQIDKFKSFFAKLEEDNVLAKTEKLFMTKKLDKLEKELENRATLRSELDLAKKDLVIAKLSLADKDIRLFELQMNVKPARKQSLVPPSVSVSNISNSHGANHSHSSDSYATAAKQMRPRDVRPLLMAKIVPLTDPSSYSESAVESILGLQTDGPIAQDIKIKNGNLVMRFNTAADRDEANKRINAHQSKGYHLFDKVFVPNTPFPLLVHFNNLLQRSLADRSDDLETKIAKEKSLISQVESSNPSLKGCVVSARVLRSSPNSHSYLVRLCVNSSALKKSILAGGRIFLENKAHRAIDVDVDKEVRRCLKCQRYGHIKHFCKSSSTVCGCCSLDHETSTCTVPKSSFKCPNCQGNHEAGHTSCRAQIAAVSRYTALFTSND